MRAFRRGGPWRWWTSGLLALLWAFAAADSFAAEPAVTPLHTLLTLPLAEHGLHVHRFHLPLAGLRVEVVDLGYITPLADALGDGEVIVNGGFWGFTRNDRRIIGLLAAGGKQFSPLRGSLDGGVLQLHRGLATIAASRGFQGEPQADLALQCRPRLVQAQALIPELNAHSRAARTAACVRDGGHTLELYLTEPEELGPSLHDLAVWLLAQGCEHALNFDGGPSTAAGYRAQGKLVRIGTGRELPYALRFKYGSRS
jgi:Phosphodiester glycosidase